MLDVAGISSLIAEFQQQVIKQFEEHVREVQKKLQDSVTEQLAKFHASFDETLKNVTQKLEEEKQKLYVKFLQQKTDISVHSHHFPLNVDLNSFFVVKLKTRCLWKKSKKWKID